MNERAAAGQGVLPVQFDGLEGLRAFQLERLKETVRRGYERVPHYRAASETAGLGSQDIAALDDLKRFPFTTKDAPRKGHSARR